MKEITPRQSAAARALLGWSQADLAERAGVSWATVQAMEAGRRAKPRTFGAVTDALASAGVRFLAPDGGPGEGVYLVSEPAPRPTDSAA